MIMMKPEIEIEMVIEPIYVENDDSYYKQVGEKVKKICEELQEVGNLHIKIRI